MNKYFFMLPTPAKRLIWALLLERWEQKKPRHSGKSDEAARTD